jgi:protein TonB
MLLAQHNILSARPSGMTPRRAMIIGGVGLLHAAAIYALMNGMVANVIAYVQPPLVVTVDTKAVDLKPVVVPHVPQLEHPVQPVDAVVPPPRVDIASEDPTPIHVTVAPPTNPPPADTGAAGLGSTHTTPPYPVAARTQSHQGTVLLQMTVSPMGDVVSATVLQSSGFPELDQAAVSWVVSHWKYKPAVQGGVTVTSQTQAAVKFDLRQASR